MSVGGGGGVVDVRRGGDAAATRRILRPIPAVARSAASRGGAAPRTGPVCGVAPGEAPAGWSIWTVNGVTYRAGSITCSNGVVRLRAYCMTNCPAGGQPAAALARGGAVQVVFDEPSADEVLDRLTPITPHLRLSPDLDKVRTSNIRGYLVGLPIYVAVDPADWAPQTATATSGPFWATVVATPVALDVTMDGDHFQCNGPGEIVTSSNWQTTTSECNHTFITRGSADVRVHIVYEHAYTSNYEPRVPFPVSETSTSDPLAVTIPVVEVQPVIVPAN